MSTMTNYSTDFFRKMWVFKQLKVMEHEYIRRKILVILFPYIGNIKVHGT